MGRDSYMDRLLAIWGNDPQSPLAALAWIESAKESKANEDLYLDFKRKCRPDRPELDDDDKSNLARAVSGFSNSDGGVIVWGVDARQGASKDDPDVVQELRPISGLKAFLTRLNTLCGSAVEPPLGGIENRAVPLAGEGDRGFIVTIIPRRRNTLARAAMGKYKGRFWLRSGSGFYEIPVAFLTEFFSRRPQPELVAWIAVVTDSKPRVEERIDARHAEPAVVRRSYMVQCYVLASNSGVGSATDVAVTVDVRGAVIRSGFHDLGGRNFYIAKPIHPRQEVPLVELEVEVPEDSVKQGQCQGIEASVGFAATDYPQVVRDVVLDGSQVVQ